MRIACVDIAHFYVQVALKEHPGLRGRPVIIGDAAGQGRCVADWSIEAAARGITGATRISEALRLCPDAALLSFEEGPYGEVWEEVLAALASFTLRIEAVQPGTAFLDITRALRVWKSEELIAAGIVKALSSMFGLNGRVGVGNSRFVAREASLNGSSRFTIVPPGEERGFVAPLPAEHLPVSEDIRERLGLLGLTTLKKIGALSTGRLVSQFGSAGETMGRLAQGAGDREGIRPRHTVTSVERERVCEPPLETMGHLAAPLAATIEGLAAELEQLRRRCRKVRLALTLRNGAIFARDFVFHRPTASACEMGRRICGALESVTLEGPVTGILLAASALSAGEDRQEGLFRGAPRDPKGFGAIRGFLAAKYGQMAVVRVEKAEEDTALPEKKFLFTAL